MSAKTPYSCYFIDATTAGVGQIQFVASLRMACELTMIFTLLKGFMKNKTKRKYVTEALYGPESLKYYLSLFWKTVPIPSLEHKLQEGKQGACGSMCSTSVFPNSQQSSQHTVNAQ